jgi:hypothetical protein
MNDELFFAWLDGELTDDAAKRVAAEVAASPALRARADRHRAFAGKLRGAFDPVIGESATPPRFADPDVVDFTHERELRERRRGRRIPVAVQWGAMAATLAIGIVAGTMLPSTGEAPVVRENGVLVASASLEDALYTRLASAPADHGPQIGLTFRDKSGDLCRSFTDDELSGLACRSGSDWKIRGLFQGGSNPAGDYRMASAGDPRLGAMIDEQIEGEPFDAAAEKAALDKGWR